MGQRSTVIFQGEDKADESKRLLAALCCLNSARSVKGGPGSAHVRVGAMNGAIMLMASDSQDRQTELLSEVIVMVLL